jgi:hypothetical protein
VAGQATSPETRATGGKVLSIARKDKPGEFLVNGRLQPVQRPVKVIRHDLKVSGKINQKRGAPSAISRSSADDTSTAATANSR